MSTLLRFIRPQGIKNKISILKLKDIKVYDTAYRSTSSTIKKEETDEQTTFKIKPTWTSYGFNDHDEKLDRHFMHQTFFVVVSICLVGGAFVIAYMPDPRLRDWAQREAYLQLRYREEKGLPLIDPNVVDPSKFVLPTDEELGDTEIII